MEELKKVIKNNRPKITESSIKTYVSMITNLFKQIHGKEKEFDYNYFLKDPDEVIEHLLKNKESKNRKTILSSLVVVCGDDNKKACQKYRSLMMEDALKSNKEYETQTKTQKQADNWISYDEVKQVYNNLKKEVSPLLSKKDLNDDELQRIQNYIILSLYTDIAPRRLMDYTELKIRGDINKDEDNYLLKNKFIFNKYKTSKFYGTQELELPLKLKLLINKWLKINNTDYLLFDTKQQKLTPSKLNQRMNKIFNKNIGASMLRHIYISDEVLADVPSLEKLKKISSDMSHNLMQQMLYKKN